MASIEAQLRERVSILEEQLAEARETIAYLERGGSREATETWHKVRKQLRLQPKATSILRLLYERRGIVSHADLEAAAWGEELPSIDALKVEIWKARKGRGLPADAIENLHGVGYRMTDEARAYVRRLVEQATAKAEAA
jgi:DNA-binding winged helix-turn-helix (wHTH) protein